MYGELLPSLSEKEGLISESKCLLLKSKDGRISKKQKKVFFGYQLAAFMKFKRK